MTRFARLNDPDPRIRGRLQSSLYYAREKNRDARKASSAPFSFDGATLGLVGSGGALPTGWEFSNPGGYFSLEVVDLNKRSDLPAMSIRIFGTNASAGIAAPLLTMKKIDVLSGQVWCLSAIAEMLEVVSDFSMPTRLSIQSRAGESYLSAARANIPADWANVSVDKTMEASATRAWANLIENQVSPGATVDVTLQVSTIKLKRVG